MQASVVGPGVVTPQWRITAAGLPHVPPAELRIDARRLNAAYDLMARWTTGKNAPVPGGAILVGRGNRSLAPRFLCQWQRPVVGCERLGVLVPSDAHPNALACLRASITDDAIIRAAVAFVTGSGVQHLADILSGSSNVSLEITARAADVTEPEALLALRDGLGADVSVVIGRHARAFHPKLWLIERLAIIAAIVLRPFL